MAQGLENIDLTGRKAKTISTPQALSTRILSRAFIPDILDVAQDTDVTFVGLTAQAQFLLRRSALDPSIRTPIRRCGIPCQYLKYLFMTVR